MISPNGKSSSWHANSLLLIIIRYDHHCFFVSNCVGENNQVSFWWYLLAQALSIWLAVPLVQQAKMGDDPNFLYWLASTGPLFGEC
jgi:hypothetical protein